VSRFSWNSPADLAREIEDSVSRFAQVAAAGEYTSWSLYWAAGVGVVGSTAGQLAAETATFRDALKRLGLHLSRHRVVPPGSVFLASSAGGVYGRCPDSPANERSACLPVSEYGRQKLRQESMLSGWAEVHGVSYLIGRISNLYGPGQNPAKPQGLMSHLIRALVLNRPVHVYVPFDTLRDYLHADDCANAVVGAMRRLAHEAEHEGARGVLKIFASEQASSIAALIGLISKITRRRPRVIHASSALTERQPRRLTFRSEMWRHDPGTHWPRIALPVGVSQVHRHILQQYRDGSAGAARASMPVS
jgi:UDP-glucose 4-epimerase